MIIEGLILYVDKYIKVVSGCPTKISEVNNGD